MFSTQKEFKSPRPARFLPKSSATSSTVDNGYCAYSALNAGQTEDAATDRSQNETAFGQSAQAYGPLPPPLRKRKFPKTVIGAPNAQDPIVPGEMAGKVAVPLLPIEEARARAGAAISRSGLPLMEQIREEQVMESGGVPTPLVRRAQSPKSPMMFVGNTHRKSQTGRAQFAASSQNSKARSITNISRSASANQTRSGAITSRPASALKLPFIPGHGVEGGAEGGDFVRWTPTPPRITTPLVNELRKNLLPRRLAIVGKSSHSPEHRGPDISERPLRPGMRKRSVTAPSALLNPQADRGESALSPLDLPDLPNLPGNPFLQAESRKTNQSGDKSDADLSPTATGRPAVDELRESDFKWSAKAHDDQRASHPSFATSLGSGYDTGHEVRGQDSADSVHDSDEEREHVSELHSASFRYQAGDSESRSSTTRRTSTIWSQSSGISENVSQDGSDRASAMESIILAPIQPLDLSPDKSRRRLPVPPRRDSTVGGEDETRTAKPELSGSAQFSPNLNFLPPTVRNGPSRRMGSLAPSVTAFSSPRQEPSIIPVPSAREDNTSFSPPSTAKTATTEVTAVSTSSNRRVSTSRKRVPVDLLNEIEAEQHQFTAQKPAPKSPMSVAEESKLKTRFSDQVSFSDGGEFAFSPPSGTVGLITPPPLLVYPGSNRQSPEILAPRPITRRRNMMPPDHVIPPFASSHSGIYGAAKKPALPEAVTPSSDAQAPKAVQTRETWRQIRKSSVTGYYLQVAQDEGDSPEIHDDEEDENVLLR
ncbi:hypothetical protein QFC19_002901 [Naganishia cerealis]|uniref:Uncharacterized protein n=1 Tax=Naganishia cerealis TaxID=610337 RepID=A0ACC2W5W1_9TREE|nr:hypothetical protein QFC19_002901 [Naganishia cerealis]